jgi:hypothetical protein
MRNFGELCLGEVRRISLPRIPVNKGEITLSAFMIHRGFIASDYSARSAV